MKSFINETPEDAFFAVFSDLSGATLFYKLDDGTYRNPIDNFEVNEIEWFFEAGYLWFIPVDMSFIKQAEEQFGERSER